MADVFSFEHYVMVEIGFVVMAAVFLIWKRPTTRLRLRMKSVNPSGTHQRGVMPVSLHIHHNHPSTLNVHFNYNGHSFDAYEVLGLPAGSSWENVKIAYQMALESNEAPSREFLKAAFHAIEKHIRGAAAS